MFDKHFVGLDLTGIEDNGVQRPISRITLLVDDENAVTAGDDTGMELTASCPHATQEMVDGLLSHVKGYQYHMFSADDADLDPAAELGDGGTFGSVYSTISKISDDGSGYAGVSAPGEAALEEDYPSGGGPMTQTFNRKIAETRSRITKTADQIRLEVANELEGLSASITVELNSITARVSDAEGNIGQLQITATLLQSQITDAVGNMSYLSQTVNSITLGVVNGQESSTISLYKNGIAVASQNITFNGMVTFNDLNGSHGTVINGSAINTGTLRLDTLYGDTIYLRDAYGNIGAQFNVGAAASASSRCEMWARAIYLGTYGGDIYLNAQTGYVTLSGSSGVTCTNNFHPNAAGRYSCGTAYFPWSAVYATTGQISSSDRAGKEAVDYDMSRYEAFFDRLRPCSFLRKDGTSGRRHHGLIAQDVAAALEETGLTGLDFAGYCAWEDEDGGSGCGLRYEELIAMLIYEVQTLKKQLRGARL